MTERIDAPAVRSAGVVYTQGGPTHIEIIMAAFRNGHKGVFEEGFVTNEGRFVGRCEAMQIAKREGQLRYPYTDYGPVLYSEDLR